MEKQTLEKFSTFLQNYKRKNGKKLGVRTINGILTLSKFIPEINNNLDINALITTFRDYLSTRNHPIAKEALSLYLKWLGYDLETIKKVVKFERQITAVRDEEKLAESVLSKKEVLKLVSEITDPRDQLIVRLFYDTAARVSELCSVKLSDIEFEKNEIKVMGKGRKPRQVYFQSQTAELLKQFIKKMRIKQDDNIIGISPAAIWYNLKRYGKQILGKDMRPHMFRHSRLQHMADDGVDSMTIKAYAGHEDIKTTQIYVKASSYQRRLAFEKAGNLWEEERKEKTGD